MTNENIKQQLLAKFPEALTDFTEPYGMLTVEVNKEQALKVLTYMHDDASMGFTYLNDLTVVHYPELVGRELCVVYMVQNISKGLRVRLKSYIPSASPEIFTASNLFSTANWLEREAYDFFGVTFIGHPNLKRIMNVDEMDYFPLRKEYKLEEQTRIDKDDDMFGR